MDPSTDDHGATTDNLSVDKTANLNAAAAASVSPVDVPTASGVTSVLMSTAVAVPNVGDAKSIEKSKGKRTTLSLHEKFIVKTFCDQQISDSKARADFVPSHDALRQEIANKFGWEVGRSTLSKIMCMDWQQLQVHAHPNPNMKRKRKPLFPAFEDDLVKSMRAHLARHDTVTQLLPDDAVLGNSMRTGPYLTEAFIMEEAQRLKQQHGIKDEELVLSVGWLARFKHRHGIRLRKGAATTMETGDGAVPSASTLPMPLQFGDAINKRLKKNAAGPPSRWPMSFQLPSLYSGMDIGVAQAIDHPVSALSDLRATCTYCATAESDATDPVEIAPPTVAAGIPVIVQQFACPHCLDALPIDIQGLHVAVIGFNCARDAFLAAALVGEHGSVSCIDTNPIATTTAEDHAELYALKTLGFAASNLKFVSLATLDHGTYSEGLDHKDLVYFNCSFHHAARKAQLLELAFNMLKEGGECRLSYVSSTRRLSHPPLHQAPSTAMHGIASTSVYAEDFRRMCQHVGFLDPRCFHVRKLESQDFHGGDTSIDHQTLSVVTARLFKLELIEDRTEDYGERATYIGGATVDTATGLLYRLDTQFTFMRDVSVAVDGNTSQILRLGWFKRIFNVEGDRMTHRGRFTYSL